MATDIKTRIAIAALSLSAAAFVGRTVHEGYTNDAIIPTVGDKPTLGFGTTERPDGSPVQLGDRTNPIEALQRTLAYTQKADARLKACVKVPLYQVEFDLLSDHGYQYGVGATCVSPMVRKANAGDYRGSCEGYKSYQYMTSPKPLGKGWEPYQYDAANRPIRWRFDCSTPGNKQCSGVWTRSVWRYEQCMSVQGG